MLVPDNIHPEQTIYFHGSFVLKTIQKHHASDLLDRPINLIDVYQQTQEEREMSISVFLLCLDWLFLLGLVVITPNHEVKLCS